MPSGKVHDSIAVISIIPVFTAGFYMAEFKLPETALFTAAALFSQLMFGPDLDAQSTQYKRWGLFRWIWIPYRKIFKHRSRFSHGLVFGPIMRCAYFGISIVLLFILFNLLVNHYTGINLAILIMPKLIDILLKLDEYTVFTYSISVLAGLFTGAAIHTFTDKITSFFKNLI